MGVLLCYVAMSYAGISCDIEPLPLPYRTLALALALALALVLAFSTYTWYLPTYISPVYAYATRREDERTNGRKTIHPSIGPTYMYVCISKSSFHFIQN